MNHFAMTYTDEVASLLTSFGICIHRSESESTPGRVNIYITTRTKEDIIKAVNILAEEFSNVSFGTPVYNKYNDAGWVLIGSVW